MSHECCSSHCHNHEETEENNSLLKKILLSSILFILAFLIEHLNIFSLKGIICNNNKNIYTIINAIFLALYATSYLIISRPIIKEVIESFRNGIKNIFNENFLMTVASLGALLIGEYTEAVVVMILFQLGEYLESKAVSKSEKSIKSLTELKPETANKKSKNGIEILPINEIKVGDIIIIKPGERVPLDGKVISGKSFLNMSALTGEFLPKEISQGDKILSGSINNNGVLEVLVESNFHESTLNRILEMVKQSQEKKSKNEKFIKKFAKIYTPIVCLISLAIYFIPLLILGENFDSKTWLYRALEILVVSCPCALVISVPLSFFSGIGYAAKKGILIKGSNLIEAISKIKTIIFDKTGTLTHGEFEIKEIHPISESLISKDKLLELACHGEFNSNHPISKSLKEKHLCENCQKAVSSLEEFSGFGISCVIDGDRILIGNKKLMEKENVQNFSESQCKETGTIIYVAKNQNYLGHIIIGDRIKNSAEEGIKRLKHLKIKNLIMLSGDNESTCKLISEKLNINEYYSELLPQDKLTILEKKLSNNTKSKTAFVGDGINDAPALSRSDIGISMGSLGSDAAIEASDIVIIDDDIRKISEVIKISKKTYSIVKQNIFFSIAIKVLIMILCIFGYTNMTLAIFGDVGVSILAILNSSKLLMKKNKVVKK